MEEPKLVKKEKIDYGIFKKNIYLLVLGLFFLLGSSYSLTFFIQNMKIGEMKITVGELTYTITSDRSVSITDLSNVSNEDGLMGYYKEISFTNTSNLNGQVSLKLNRTSGVELTSLRYGIYANDELIDIGNVPSDGIIYHSAILGGEEINFKIYLWLQENSSTSETTFEGEIEPVVTLDSLLGSKYLSSLEDLDEHNYVTFNNETWRIKGVEDGRIVITKTEYLSNTFTNSNLFNTSNDLIDDSLVVSMSTDNHALYLRKTTKIVDGEGTQEKPYVLGNKVDDLEDRKIIGYITYNDGENDLIPTQALYYGKTNYVSRILDDMTFDSWTENADGTGKNYHLGDTINVSSNTTIYAKYVRLLYNVLKHAAKVGTYAREYTGAHQDSMDASKSTEKIYHWYADTNDNGTAITNMNNVVFGNQCWQMIRTTDTGGVKLLYNGEPTITGSGDNLSYDCGTTRPGHIGGIESTQSLNGNYYYGDGYTTSVSGTTTTFTLTNPTQITVDSSNASTAIPSIAESTPYTCRSTSSTGTCTKIYKVDSQQSGTTAYVYASTDRDTIGLTNFNSDTHSISNVGYMYNQEYTVSITHLSNATYILSSATLNTTTLTNYSNYYYGDSYTMSGNTHVLTNPVQGNTLADFPNDIVGKYMCQSSSSSSCSTMYYISAIDNSGTNPIIYYAQIVSGKKDDDASYKYLFGDAITDNGDGTFTLTGNTQEINKKDWHTIYSSMNNKYVCMPGYYTYDTVNDKYTCSDNGEQNKGALGYLTATTITNFTATSIYKYGFGITSDNGSYKLVGNNNEDGTLQYIYNWTNTSTTSCFTNSGDSISQCGYQTLSKSHYTCYNLTGKCNTYYYINYTSSTSIYSAGITGGKYVSTDLTDTNNILYEMLYKSDVNTTNSTIKGNIDNWYQKTLLTTFDQYIDDTIYCNDRTITSFGGWNPNGGTTSSNYSLQFKEYVLSSSDLSCANTLDKFSVSNNAAKLIYKVGLMTSPEKEILKNVKLTSNTYEYFTSSPSLFGFENAAMVNSSYRSTTSMYNVANARPAISLVASMEYEKGTGATNNPYIVKTD